MQAGDELGEYRIVSELSAGRSWLARSRGRDVVLKRLEEDCLLAGRLHPTIAERLKHVRDLPQKNVANLHGVETDRNLTLLVWDYVSGVSLDQALESGVPFEQVARELVLAVDALHARGIVHGRIHAGNVLVDEHSRVWLIDISPLLFSDPREDATGLLALLRLTAQSTGDARMLDLLAAVDERNVTVQELDRRLTGRDRAASVDQIDSFDGIHWRSLLWAALALAIGIAVALWVPWSTLGRTPPPATMSGSP